MTRRCGKIFQLVSHAIKHHVSNVAGVVTGQNREFPSGQPSRCFFEPL